MIAAYRLDPVIHVQNSFIDDGQPKVPFRLTSVIFVYLRQCSVNDLGSIRKWVFQAKEGDSPGIPGRFVTVLGVSRTKGHRLARRRL